MPVNSYIFYLIPVKILTMKLIVLCIELNISSEIGSILGKFFFNLSLYFLIELFIVSKIFGFSSYTSKLDSSSSAINIILSIFSFKT